MPKPSVYKQIDAVQVTGRDMKPSPRCWNPGMIRYKGRLWMCYRYHLGREHASRCATALVPLDKKTFQPTAPSQHLNLPAVVGDEHFEDARLFFFKGEPHISYNVMSGYQPGKDYSCSIRYARLKLSGNRWLVEQTFWPTYGQNNGYAKEKNWCFFDYNGELYCVYKDTGKHTVIKLEGEKVIDAYETPAPMWPWGTVRGGSPPVPFGEGKFLCIFHSSVPTEEAPHYVRYFGAAYVMEAKPPFKITLISPKPILSGSEADGHGPDPRYSAGWKPFVPFPCGCVPDGDDYLLSFGVNDWQCAVGRLRAGDLKFTSADGSESETRYFRTINGSRAVNYVGPDGHMTYIHWENPPRDLRFVVAAPAGFLQTTDPRLGEDLSEISGVEEITREKYLLGMKKILPPILA